MFVDLGKGGQKRGQEEGAAGQSVKGLERPGRARLGRKGGQLQSKALGGTLGEDGASQPQEPSFPAGH